MQCKWSEQKPNNCGKRERSLAISCSKNKQNPNPPKCSYRGDPHPCQWYNKNQKAFYQCLVDVMVKDGNLCTTSHVNCHNHCKEITFNKQNNNAINNDPWELVESSEEEIDDLDSDEDFLLDLDELLDEEEDDFNYRPFV
ncbi:hypothetical protein ACF0H5_009462 [Mactra antiquata]